ncbi:terminase large subunit [Parvimonas micra]|uniref:terminase large subunit n=1 Tax=Parvimonas micra TaxID=33033 RepID=UPI00241FF9DD|nr:terminase TerL endonuclease subunit [Parvimonas micra]
MIEYSNKYNPITEYEKWVEKYPKKVGKLMKIQLKMLISDIKNKESDVYYDYKKANHAIEFIENFCRNIKGKTAGKLVVLDPFQKAFIAAIFGICYKKTKLRRTKRAVLIEAKKNGKSLLASAIGLYMLIADGEGGPECYSVATQRDQAKIIWNVAKKMIKKDKDLRRYTKTLVSEISCKFNDGIFKPLASDSDTLDGLDVHFVVMDEIHQWKNGFPLYDIMYRGMDNRQQPLALITSTAGTIREDLYDMIYDEAVNILTNEGFEDKKSIFFIYELDKREEWKDFNNLIKANPGLGTIRNEQSLRDEWQRAMDNPSMYFKTFLIKNCNIRETSTESWLDLEDVTNPKTFDIKKLKPRYVISGWDISSTTDLTCVSFLFRIQNDEDIYIYQHFFIPEDVAEKKIHNDKVPYDIWEKQGYVTYCPGNKIDTEFLWEWAYNFAIENDFVQIWNGFDAWGAELLMKRYRENYGESSVEEIKQVFKTLSNPMKELEADLKAKRINFNNNPVTKWCLGNTVIQQDNKGNIQPKKGYSSLKRIDGTASMLDCYITYKNHKDDYLNLI